MDHLKSDDNTKFTGNFQPHNGILPKQPKPVGPGQYPGANSSSFGAQVFSNHKNLQTYSFGLPDNRWVGSYHRDSDFGYSDYELNAICALTPMHASAALHVEQL